MTIERYLATGRTYVIILGRDSLTDREYQAAVQLGTDRAMRVEEMRAYEEWARTEKR